MHRRTPGFRSGGATACVAVAACVLLAGCAATRTNNPFEGGASDEIRITVTNHNLQDVTIYALAPAVRERLGRVGSNSADTFTMHWSHTRELRLELDFLAGPRCFSYPLMVSPGDEVDVTVERSLTRMDCR